MFFFPHDTFVGPFIWFAARACRLFHRVDINPRVFFYKFCCSIHHLAFFLLLFHSCCLHTDAWSCVSGSMHSFWPCARCGNDWCFINEIWKYSHVRCALIHFDFCNVFVRHFYVSRLVLSSHFPSNIYWINKQTVCCCGCLFFRFDCCLLSKTYKLNDDETNFRICMSRTFDWNTFGIGCGSVP